MRFGPVRHGSRPISLSRPPAPGPCAGRLGPRLAPGQSLFHEGDQAISFFGITDGTLRCYRVTREGRRHIFRFAGPGDLLGLGSEVVYGYSAEAVTRVATERHPLAGLDRAMAEDPAVRRRVLRALRAEISLVRRLSMLRGCMSADGKVASFLLERAAVVGEGDCIRIPMTRSDIADYLGLAIETVSRKINELRAAGLVDLVGPRDLRIVDRDGLTAVAEAG